jgi:hypothetical protein
MINAIMPHVHNVKLIQIFLIIHLNVIVFQVIFMME